jgi:hypothetical protein
MRPRRGHLFWGITLLLLGGIPLAARAGLLPADALQDAWRLWPVALIAAGVALILFRRASGTAGVVAAGLAAGVVGGTVLAGGGAGFAFFECGNPGPVTGSSASTATDSGSFDGPASVSLTLNCGRLDLASGGTGWAFEATYAGTAPRIDASGDSLQVDSGDGPFNRRQAWQVDLPEEGIDHLDLQTNAGAATLDFGRALLGVVEVETNAGEVVIRAGDAELGGLSASTNAGTLRITLGEAAMTGDLSANAGSIDLCVPDDVELRLVVEENITFGHNLDDRGLRHEGTVWTRPGSGDTITLQVEGNASSLDLDPEEGCG